MWSEVEWSHDPQARCVQDAAVHCLAHVEHIVDRTATSKQQSASPSHDRRRLNADTGRGAREALRRERPETSFFIGPRYSPNQGLAVAHPVYLIVEIAYNIATSFVGAVSRQLPVNFGNAKMRADTAGMAPVLRATPPSKVRILTLGHLDRRTCASRRAAALAEAFAAEIGGQITHSLRICIETAAALSVIAEDAQTRRLAGDSSVSLDEVVRAVSAARRALRDIGIRPNAKPEQLGPTLAEYIASKRTSAGAGR